MQISHIVPKFAVYLKFKAMKENENQEGLPKTTKKSSAIKENSVGLSKTAKTSSAKKEKSETSAKTTRKPSASKEKPEVSAKTTKKPSASKEKLKAVSKSTKKSSASKKESEENLSPEQIMMDIHNSYINSKEYKERERILKLVDERRRQRYEESQKHWYNDPIKYSIVRNVAWLIAIAVFVLILMAIDKPVDFSDTAARAHRHTITAPYPEEVVPAPRTPEETAARTTTKRVVTPVYTVGPYHIDNDGIKTEVDRDGKIHITIDPKDMSHIDRDKIMQNYLESVDINDLMDYYGYDPE